MSTGAPLRIDQALHGYDRGHRELARSTPLDADAHSTMLIASDLIIDEIPSGSRSYLTCYPLRSIARHVLSCTWSAGPKYRPGSVWTHSLLLDYQTLAQLPDLARLRLLFQHPENTPLETYRSPITADLGTDGGSLDVSAEASAIAIAGLYGAAPQERVAVPIGSPAANDGLALALWRQMWPSLRRDFAFVTGTTGRSSPLSAGCVLAFEDVPNAPASLSRGQELLQADLVLPGPTALRGFLSRYVVEGRNPRALAPTLAEIWHDSGEDRAGQRMAAIGQLARSHDLHRMKKDLIAAELTRVPDGDRLIDVVREFGAEPLNPLPEATQSRLLGAARQRLEQLLPLGFDAAPGSLAQQIFQLLALNAEPDELLKSADDDERASLLRLRPMLAFEPAFWPMEDRRRAVLLAALPEDVDLTIDQILHLFGTDIGQETAIVLADRLLDRGREAAGDILSIPVPALQKIAARLVIEHDDELNNVLNGIEPTSAGVLAILSDAMTSDCKPIGSLANWLIAAQKIADYGGTLSPSTRLVVAAAAILQGGVEGLVTMRSLWDRVYTDVRRYRLSPSEERWLEQQMPAKSSGSTLRTRLLALSIERWPPNYSSAGALTLSRERDNVRDMVSAVRETLGKSALALALDDNDLSAEAVAQIGEVIAAPRPRRGWLF